MTPYLVVGDHAYLVTEVREGVLEGVQVGGRGAVDQPGYSFKADSSIDDLDGQLFPGSIRESLVLHEDHVAELETTDKVLD